ncbi:hypothetical protein MPTK1_2g19830 [Marchantia polymorpha subsp. ruderalis]|uniref:Uncharacterized protein n=1 Tax=Marchantia polymorpha TaxID=3197 RepID=A0A2R6WVC6_MARPO|nr:hypothetical protein MARPO_0055s0067 [Marchantia polymorpha]BBN02985.1 hypothetical protein Mp_2g19830 [Marchantia polymorpha subsp. ruderalis]|eukprot:PTQ37804.1 hypothetical protein MARPO_0055s0067 [Marchantia polymorpha]
MLRFVSGSIWHRVVPRTSARVNLIDPMVIITDDGRPTWRYSRFSIIVTLCCSYGMLAKLGIEPMTTTASEHSVTTRCNDRLMVSIYLRLALSRVVHFVSLCCCCSLMINCSSSASM